MTPKEKAEELVARFRIVNYDLDDIDNHKECALIAVDEIINSYTKEKSQQYILSDKIIPYWEQVKQEIEKL